MKKLIALFAAAGLAILGTLYLTTPFSKLPHQDLFLQQD
jgi:hypothetical protein